jgi:hypothetical protein
MCEPGKPCPGAEEPKQRPNLTIEFTHEESMVIALIFAEYVISDSLRGSPPAFYMNFKSVAHKFSNAIKEAKKEEA